MSAWACSQHRRTAFAKSPSPYPLPEYREREAAAQVRSPFAAFGKPAGFHAPVPCGMLSCGGKGAFVTAPTTPFPLPYAGPPSRWGVTREQPATGLWVIVPPVPSLRYLVKSHGWAVIPLGLALT